MAEKNVRIRLFKDNSRYKGDLFVSVNGVNYKIRRGVEVEVPPAVAEVLEHSQRQDDRRVAQRLFHFRTELLLRFLLLRELTTAHLQLPGQLSGFHHRDMQRAKNGWPLF